MDRDFALKKLQECVSGDDPERYHQEADDVLCALLRELGYGDVVDVYEKVKKYYA